MTKTTSTRLEVCRECEEYKLRPVVFDVLKNDETGVGGPFLFLDNIDTWREGDPSTRKILEGGTIFRLVYMGKFGPYCYPRVEKELKMAAINNKKIGALLLSLMTLITTFQQQLAILYNW